MDAHIHTTVPVPDQVISQLVAGLPATRAGHSFVEDWMGPDYLPSRGVVVDRVYFLDLIEGPTEEWMVTMDEVISRALALIPGELAIVTEYDTVMVDRTAEGEVRYRSPDDFYRPYLVKSLGPV